MTVRIQMLIEIDLNYYVAVKDSKLAMAKHYFHVILKIYKVNWLFDQVSSILLFSVA